MAELPKLPDHSKRELVLKWSALLDTHHLTGEHLHWREESQASRRKRIQSVDPAT